MDKTKNEMQTHLRHIYAHTIMFKIHWFNKNQSLFVFFSFFFFIYNKYCSGLVPTVDENQYHDNTSK